MRRWIWIQLWKSIIIDHVVHFKYIVINLSIISQYAGKKKNPVYIVNGTFFWLQIRYTLISNNNDELCSSLMLSPECEGRWSSHGEKSIQRASWRREGLPRTLNDRQHLGERGRASRSRNNMNKVKWDRPQRWCKAAQLCILHSFTKGPRYTLSTAE